MRPPGSPGSPGTDERGCPEGRRRELSRRGVLKALAGTGLLTAMVGEAQFAFGAADPNAPANVLVVVVLSGGMDGLSAIVPLGDPDYAPNRPTTTVPAGSAIQVDSRFGLHPALAPLYPLWTAGTFGAVHAAGQASPSRSHLDAMDALGRGGAESTGWLDRALRAVPGTTDAASGVSVGRADLPGLLRGPHPELAGLRLDDIVLPMDLTVTPAALWQQAVNQLHEGGCPGISQPVKCAFTALNRLTAALPAHGDATGGPLYPADAFGRGLADIARLVRAGAGLRMATVQLGGWDTHVNHGTVDGGVFTSQLKNLAEGLAAFATDLGPDLERVTVVTLSEFGRRVRQNGNNGLDHGHGGVMLALGGGVDGGKVHGTWPGLAPANLSAGQDLAVTTDYRAVISEVLTTRLGVTSATAVFPGYRAASVGLMRS